MNEVVMLLIRLFVAVVVALLVLYLLARWIALPPRDDPSRTTFYAPHRHPTYPDNIILAPGMDVRDRNKRHVAMRNKPDPDAQLRSGPWKSFFEINEDEPIKETKHKSNVQKGIERDN